MKPFKRYLLFSFTIITLVIPVSSVLCQHPLQNRADAVEIRYAAAQPVIGYTLQVDAADLAVYKVEMRIRNVPDTFRVAMMAHPEYDDRFWRYVKDIRVETNNGTGNILREDSALWRVVAHGNEVLLKYSIQLPPPPEGLRAAWRPFLAATGGLAGGPQSFMYIPGATLAPSHISLQIPQGWMIATGLEATADPFTFYAASAAVLRMHLFLWGILKPGNLLLTRCHTGFVTGHCPMQFPLIQQH